MNVPVFLSNPALAIEVISGSSDDALPGWNVPNFVGAAVSEITYAHRTRKSGLDLITMTALANEVLPKIKTPHLVMKSQKDLVIPPKCADYIVSRAGSKIKKLEWLDNSYHTSQLDLDSDKIVNSIQRFLLEINFSD